MRLYRLGLLAVAAAMPAAITAFAVASLGELPSCEPYDWVSVWSVAIFSVATALPAFMAGSAIAYLTASHELLVSLREAATRDESP